MRHYEWVMVAYYTAFVRVRAMEDATPAKSFTQGQQPLERAQYSSITFLSPRHQVTPLMPSFIMWMPKILEGQNLIRDGHTSTVYPTFSSALPYQVAAHGVAYRVVHPSSPVGL